MITHVAKTLRRPFYWFLLQTTQDKTWKRYNCKVPLHVYGAGSRRCFSWYLEGEIDSDQMDLEDMTYWLDACQYMTDKEQFDERDVWQHPITFERIRRGDCEDFSLWTWRKMVESGINAEFCAGWSVHPGELYQGHTWVLFEAEDTTFMFDPVAQDRQAMVRPLHEVSEWYVPQVSIDSGLSQYVYGGYYNSLRPGWKAASANR